MCGMDHKDGQRSGDKELSDSYPSQWVHEGLGEMVGAEENGRENQNFSGRWPERNPAQVETFGWKEVDLMDMESQVGTKKASDVSVLEPNGRESVRICFMGPWKST